MTRPELLRETRSVEYSAEDVGTTHSNHIPEEDGEHRILETIQDKEMDNSNYCITGNDGKRASSHGSISRRSELGSGHYTHIQHVQYDHNNKMHLHIGWVAVEAVVDYRNIGTGNENANSAVIQCLENIVSREAETIILMENVTRTHAPNSTGNENHDWPMRDLLLVCFAFRHCYKVH